MKYAAAFLFLAIVVGACVLLANGQAADEDSPTPPERGERAMLVVVERSADDMSRGAHQLLETAPAATPAPRIGEREMTERLWMAFNSDLENQNQVVEPDRIVQLIRDDPDLARELAKDIRP